MLTPATFGIISFIIFNYSPRYRAEKFMKPLNVDAERKLAKYDQGVNFAYYTSKFV